MLNKKQSMCCRVCGLNQGEFPWGVDEKTPSFMICDCCGVEFGYEDCTVEYVKKFRKAWMNKKKIWFNSRKKPSNWSLEDQLKNIPEEFK